MKTQPLSPTEEKLLSLIPKGGSRINSKQLTDKFYKDKEQPFNARLIVAGAMRNLIRKLEYNKSSTKVKKSKRRGHHPIEYWIET